MSEDNWITEKASEERGAMVNAGKPPTMTTPPTHGLTRAHRGIGNDCRSVYDQDGHLVATTIRAEDGTTIVKAVNENTTLRNQLDTSMRRQETLATNVNDGLLEIRALKDEMEGLKQRVEQDQGLVRKINDLTAQLAQVKRERDLAIAHDRQPYPTAWAYNQACAALEQGKQQLEAQAERIAELEREVL